MAPTTKDISLTGAAPVWSHLVARVKRNDTAGLEELYEIFAKRIRLLLQQQLGCQDIEDRVHDIFLIVTGAIRRGHLREPERLMGFVRTIARRQVAAGIEHNVTLRTRFLPQEQAVQVADGSGNPEQEAIVRQHGALAMETLNYLAQRDREILVRFYLQEETQDEICSSMNLTGTQFRLYKNRAKARFGAAGKKRLAGLA